MVIRGLRRRYTPLPPRRLPDDDNDGYVVVVVVVVVAFHHLRYRGLTGYDRSTGNVGFVTGIVDVNLCETFDD